MTEFRKIRRFTGTKKVAASTVLLQCRDSSGIEEVGQLAIYCSNSPWNDVLDISKLGPFIEEIPWETPDDEKAHMQASEAAYREALR